MENHAIFISNNKSLLTSCILFFHSLIQPLKWAHPLVFTITEDLMHIFDSPVPILGGVSKHFRYVLCKKII